MPGGDGTGPAGMGPMTGRAAGYCAGYPVPGYMNAISHRGFGAFGRGRGGGWGRRNWFHATGPAGWQRAAMGMPAYGAPPAYPMPYAAPFGPTQTAPLPQQELEALQGQAEYFQDALEGIRKRIEELQSQVSEKTE